MRPDVNRDGGNGGHPIHSLARMTLDQLDPNLVRPFDEREFDLAARYRANFIRHFDAVLRSFSKASGSSRP